MTNILGTGDTLKQFHLSVYQSSRAFLCEKCEPSSLRILRNGEQHSNLIRDFMLTGHQNSLFNSALKQSSQLRTDLDNFATASSNSPAALQG